MISKQQVFNCIKKLAENKISLYDFDYDIRDLEGLYFLYIELFHTVPEVHGICDKIHDYSIIENEKPKKLDEKRLDWHNTCHEILKSYEGSFVFQSLSSDIIFGNNFIICGRHIFCENINEFNFLKDKFKFVEEEKNATIRWVTLGPHGFNTSKREINNIEFDPDNYNDDIPLDRLEEEITRKESSLILLHGTAGTGKTTLIRSLISKYNNKKFYYVDGRSLYGGDTQYLADLLIECKDGIFIIEDCEMLLSSRDNGNGALSTILNITDGMLGDSLGLKFICTFNTDINNLDKAIIRKGRLKLKYEFKNLTKDKVSKLFTKLNIDAEPKEMPLCDVYNYNLDNGNKKERNKIGF